MGCPVRWEQLATPHASDASTDEGPVKTASLRGYLKRLIARTLIGTAAVVLLVIGLFSLVLNGAQEPPLSLDSTPAGTVASAVAPKVVRHLGFVSVTGKMVNRSSATLDKVAVVVDLLDSNRRTLRTQSAMVALDKIAPGQATGFQCEMADDPKANAYRLHFKTLFGEDIN